MISGTRVATSFTSLWQDLLPTGEAFVRRMNLDKRRFVAPLDSRVEPGRRALVNEMGFTMFKSSMSEGFPLNQTQYTREDVEKIYLQAWETVRESKWFEGLEVDEPDNIEHDEVVEIARRLRNFFRTSHPGKDVMVSPDFPGCGFVDDCVGDVWVEETLYEVKAGERTFRLVDVRQVLLYLALNQSSKCYDITGVGFLNPRMGLFHSISVGDLVSRVAGKSSVELLSDIVYFISSGDLSR